MAVVNADTGKVIATPAIGEGVDANGFDPGSNLAFASNGEGTLTVVHEDSPDKFTIVESVPTKRSARTLGLDFKTHNIYLPAADFDPPDPGQRRGKMKPGSFVLLIVTRGYSRGVVSVSRLVARLLSGRARVPTECLSLRQIDLKRIRSDSLLQL